MDYSSLALVCAVLVMPNTATKGIASARLSTMDHSSPQASMLASPPDDRSGAVFNVVDYGACGDGVTDDSQAFIKAWEDACKSTVGGTPTYMIPQGKTFLLKPIALLGPCNSQSIEIQLQGDLVAPRSLGDWTGCLSDSWIVFLYIQRLSIYGSGQLDGQGSLWWKASKKHSTRAFSSMAMKGCMQPTAVHFGHCRGLRVNGFKSLNSPRNHISLHDCKDTEISNIQLTAPERSPNTDGIDISSSSYVYIHDSFIGTGDDCIAINNGSSNINVTRVTCGPGHGISIGSLGAKRGYNTVQNINVKNCTFNGTQNGARIKTWEGGSGFASNILFEDIIVDKSRNPIIIDQHYCNGKRNCPPNSTSSVHISNVVYRRFAGTSASVVAVRLNCSEIVPCNDLVFDRIDLVPDQPGHQLIKAYCENAEGKILSPSTPRLDCLDHGGSVIWL